MIKLRVVGIHLTKASWVQGGEKCGPDSFLAKPRKEVTRHTFISFLSVAYLKEQLLPAFLFLHQAASALFNLIKRLLAICIYYNIGF
jgi:hypothetical protein